jgi:hypothetical protein
MFTFKLEQADGTPADPPSITLAVPNTRGLGALDAPQDFHGCQALAFQPGPELPERGELVQHPPTHRVRRVPDEPCQRRPSSVICR